MTAKPRRLLDTRQPLGPYLWENPRLGTDTYEKLKLDIHQKLLQTIDLTKASALDSSRIESDVRRALEDLVMAEPMALSRADRARLVVDVEHEVFGLGPLEELIKDPEVSDILVNNYASVFVENIAHLRVFD